MVQGSRANRRSKGLEKTDVSVTMIYFSALSTFFPLPHGSQTETTYSQMRGFCPSPLAATLLLVLLQCSVSSAGQFSGDSSKLSGIIIPGFASTQLRAWSILDCPYSPLDFNPLDLVWLDTRKVCICSFRFSFPVALEI